MKTVIAKPSIFDNVQSNEERTEVFHNWLKNQTNTVKRRFAYNWNIPHSLFNAAVNYFKQDELQGINWFEIFQTHDFGGWNKFDQTKGIEQISFHRVVELYGNEPMDIKEAYFNNGGWQGLKNSEGDYQKATKKRIWELAMVGVTHFHFIVLNKTNEFVNTDYSIEDLIK